MIMMINFSDNKESLKLFYLIKYKDSLIIIS